MRYDRDSWEMREALAKAAGVKLCAQTKHIAVVTPAGKLRGGVLFDNFHHVSMQIHVAGLCASWLTKRLLWAAFDYPFNVAGCRKLISPVPSGNRKSLDFAARLGFKEETRVSDVFPDGDLVFMTMQRDQCPWLHLGDHC